MLFRVLGYWLLALYWGAGCLAVGLALLERVAPRQYRAGEAPFVAFPLGVLAFVILTFLVALAGRLGAVFFFVAPAALVAAGWKSLTAFVARLPRFDPWPRSFSRLEGLALAFGAVGLVLVYVPILTPHNVQHDARWYHLPIAAQYASLHAVPRFPEGWYLGAYPHLSSILYAWALLWPVGIVHRLALCAHMEFLVFLVTIASVPALVRRALPGVRLPLSWAAFFLFPGLLVYDSNLSTGADHIAAVWAPGGLLALIAALRTSSPRHAVLVGAMAAGAALTKYSALCVAAPLLVAVALRSAVLLHRGQHTRRAQLALAGAGASFAVLWSPHWLKNWALYGDPLYPMLSRYFAAHPWNAQAAMYHRLFLRKVVLQPTHDLGGVLDSIFASLTLGFRVHEYEFHAEVPTFGFLFAATLYCAPFLSVGRRVWLAYGLGLSSAVVWYWTNHRDRYLQACLPWLVTATVCVLWRAFESRGKLGRAAAVLLVGAQVASGAGNFLIPANPMAPGGHALPHVIRTVKAGIDRKYASRFEPFPEWNFADWVAIGRDLPKGARVLVHQERLWVGLDAPVVVDEAAWQAGIRYGTCENVADVDALLRSHGVTHVVAGESHGDGGTHGIAGNLLFWAYLASHAPPPTQRGKLTLWELRAAPPPRETLGRTLILTCNQSQPPGLYEFDQIGRRGPFEASGAVISPDQVARADYYVVEENCGYPTSLPGFRLLRGSYVRGPDGSATFGILYLARER